MKQAAEALLRLAIPATYFEKLDYNLPETNFGSERLRITEDIQPHIVEIDMHCILLKTFRSVCSSSEANELQLLYAALRINMMRITDSLGVSYLNSLLQNVLTIYKLHCSPQRIVAADLNFQYSTFYVILNHLLCLVQIIGIFLLFLHVS